MRARRSRGTSTSGSIGYGTPARRTLLAGSSFAFAVFAVSLSRASVGGTGAATKVAVVVMAVVFTALVCVAAAALATVSMSIGFGTITGDPGTRHAQDLLPQFGYVLLTVPGARSPAGSRCGSWLRLPGRRAPFPGHSLSRAL
jgi:hypothetical protein